MKKIIYLAAFAAALTSCRSAQKHFEIAQRKGLVLQSDTIVTETIRYDTIRDTETNEIIRIDTLTVRTTETRKQPVFVNMSRQERKAMQDSMRHVERVLKSEFRHERTMFDKHARHLERQQKDYTKHLRKQARIDNRHDRKNKIRPIQWVGLILFLVLIFGILRYVTKN